MGGEATGRDDLGPVDRLLRGVAEDPVQRVALALRLDALRAGGAAERKIAALREELDALRAEMTEHKQRLAELQALLTAAMAVRRPAATAHADLELTPEAQAELDRLADWPFLDEYPPVADP